jgi:hypothetical protein
MKIAEEETTRPVDVVAIPVHKDLVVVNRILRIRQIVIVALVMTVTTRQRTNGVKSFQFRGPFLRLGPPTKKGP